MTDRLRALLFLALAIVALNASVTFLNIWPTPLVHWTGLMSVEFAVVVLGLSVAHARGQAPSRRVLGLLTVAWLALVLGRYIFVTSPALWGRDLNFYWDLRFLPDVLEMLASAAPWWMDALALAGIALTAWLAYALTRWALGVLNRALAIRARRSVLSALAVIAVVLFGCQRLQWLPDPLKPFAVPVSEGYGHQARSIFNAVRGADGLPASPSFESDLSRLGGEDVLLFFIESYGAITYERPEFNDQLTTRRALLDAAIRDSGHDVVSGFVTSPTFGGSSWFAHISLLSGVTIGDPDRNARLMTERRDTLPSFLGRHGYRSIALMPGLWSPWPDGAFYGFAKIYDGPGLHYLGPPFGWWDMPDQVTFGKLDQLELSKPGRSPLFVFFPTVSTHTPFVPVPPYQPDWQQVVSEQPFASADLEKAYDETPDWTNLGPAYAQSVNYIYEALAGYLLKHRDEHFVMILLGDHQPPALVSGEGAPWEVPVHIISSNRAILARLKARGFQTGLTPSRPTLGPMSALTSILLDAFGDPQRVNAN